MVTRITYYLMWMLLYFFAVPVTAENEKRGLVLSHAAASLSVSAYSEILEDPTRRLTLAEVISPKQADKFTAYTRKNAGFGEANSAFWVRFDLTNQSELTWYLLMDGLRDEQPSLFIVSDDVTTHAAQKPTQYRYPLWSLHLPKAQKLRFYIRVSGSGTSFNFPIELLTSESLLIRSNADYRFHSARYTALLIFATYHFVLFFVAREFSRLMLAIDALSAFVILHTYDPVFESLLFLGRAGHYFFTAAIGFAMGSLSLLLRQTLQTQSHFPGFDAVLKTLVWLSGLFIPIASMIPENALASSVLPLTLFPAIFLTGLLVALKARGVADCFFFKFLIALTLGTLVFMTLLFNAIHGIAYKNEVLGIPMVGLVLLLFLDQAEQLRRMRGRLQRMAARGAAKDSFLATLSHELRTPLNAIVGLCTLLQRGPLSAKQQTYVKKLDISSRYMVQLTDTLLTINHKNENFSFENKPFKLEAICAYLYGLLHEQAIAKGLALSIKGFEDVTETLHGDPVRLSQVLINLVSNGIKYTMEGDVTLFLEKLPVLATPEKLVLRFGIIDTGIGIDPNKMEKLFGPFAPSEPRASYAQRGEGLGLGLVISKNIVERMGGKLEVESTPGKGSHFFFSVPFTIQNEAVAFDQDASVSETRCLLPKTRVLLVNDCEINVFIWRKLINSIGGDVTIALDGKSTLLQIQQSSFDIVLMDINLPDMDGFAVTRWIRQHSRHPKIPIIALTAHSTPTIEQQCKNVGINGFLAKPFEPNEVYRTIYRALHE